MTKYARPVSIDGAHRMVDVIDTSDYEPRPSWGQVDADLLDRIFAPNKITWVNANAWFVPTLDGVQDGAVHTGEDYSDPSSYINPDGSDGNRHFPDEPEPE